MPIRPFKSVPANLVEWGRYLVNTHIEPSTDSVGTTQLKDGQVTYAKIQSVKQTRLLGRAQLSAGTVEEISVDGGIEFSGSQIQRSALTGDIEAGAGSDATTFRQFSACSVLGRSQNTAGAPTEVAAASNGHYLRRTSDAVSFGAILDADLPSTIARDSEVTSAISALNLASGTYTPTVTGVTNIDAVTAFVAQYLRVGSVVTVSGRLDIDPTSAAQTQVGISLPVASNFSDAGNLAGVAQCQQIAMGAAILADTTNDRALLEYVATDTANRNVWYTFTYRII